MEVYASMYTFRRHVYLTIPKTCYPAHLWIDYSLDQRCGYCRVYRVSSGHKNSGASLRCFRLGRHYHCFFNHLFSSREPASALIDYFISCMARHIFCGVAGMSIFDTPISESAFVIALITEGIAPAQPASPQPLTPRAFVCAGLGSLAK